MLFVVGIIIYNWIWTVKATQTTQSSIWISNQCTWRYVCRPIPALIHWAHSKCRLISPFRINWMGFDSIIIIINGMLCRSRVHPPRVSIHIVGGFQIGKSVLYACDVSQWWKPVCECAKLNEPEIQSGHFVYICRCHATAFFYLHPTADV